MIKDSAGICDAIHALCDVNCRECTSENSTLKRDNEFCRICTAYQRKKYGVSKCVDIEQYAYYQAERWGGSYEFLCPAGCAFTCATFGGHRESALLAGPFRIVEMDDFLQNDLPALLPVAQDILTAARQLPYIEPKRVPYITDTLFALALHVSRQSDDELESLELASLYTRRQYENLVPAPGEYPIYKEQQLRMYMSRGERDLVGHIINELLGYVYFESGANFDAVKSRIMEIAVILSRGAIDGGASIEKILHLNDKLLPQIPQLQDMNQLNYWLAHALVMYTRCVFNARGNEYSPVVIDIINYVKRHFNGKLTLNDIADHVSFSVSYVSRIFKSETGESLSAFINRVRIDHAKAALLSDTSLVEIAMECGFEDQSYFNKVFKKYVGCTPSAYKHQKGNLYKKRRNS